MGALVYSAIASLDGYTADESGGFGWAEPRPAVHRFINETEGSVRTMLYGRRMYETMQAWDTGFELAKEFAFIGDFQRLWQESDKIVYSGTLPAVRTRRTTLERTFDPAAVAERARASEHDTSIGGPRLAATALRAGIVDEVRWFVVPVTVGGGTPFLPAGLRLTLDLLEERRFADGTVYLRYAVRR
ncbi:MULTISPECIES: dihydrofolate reductase family protein [unclassified Rathayibacter]|uniref:dihydrofolate reductase family protein n=1 Tax=unclassified Rathayibacter TaxID=2609250 RepID=UPI0006FED1DD|nr:MULTISPECIES: dihydrofolate reductase family protein [unclassified Rathayibacter]KQQ00746.1 deaminase [Rathayibacter sp. Leaf294]KQS10946.1 deaminase [Rathayibacter sp. Leaf185]